MSGAPTAVADGTIHAATALPPRVRGNTRGTIALTIDSVAYYATSRDFAPRRTGPLAGAGLEAGSTLVRLAWWGEQGGGSVWRPEVHALDTEGCEVPRRSMPTPAAASTRVQPAHALREREQAPLPPTRTVLYPIVVSTNSFTNYLHDAQWLVFELHHFLETDPAQTHRDFLKTLSRAAHANRAWPQPKPPLANVMLDLAPLADAMGKGAGQFISAKNLPIIISGVPVGHVSVRISCTMEDGGAGAAASGTAAQQLHPDSAGPFGAEAFGHELGGVTQQQQQQQQQQAFSEMQQQQQQQQPQVHPSSPQINPFPAPLSSMEPSPHSSPNDHGPSHSQRRARERHGHGAGPWDPALGQMPPTDRFDMNMSIAGLIKQAEEVAQGIEESMQHQPVRHAAPRQAQQGQGQEQTSAPAAAAGPLRFAASESTLRGIHLDDPRFGPDEPEEAARSHGPPAPASRRAHAPLAKEEEEQHFAQHSFARSAAAAAAAPVATAPHGGSFRGSATAAPASANPFGTASQHQHQHRPLSASASSTGLGQGGPHHRPFSAPPPFADFTPAPADFFGAPPLPPAPVGPVPPPFGDVVASARPRTRRDDPSSFLDDGGLITVWLRLRCVRLDSPLGAGPPTAGSLAAELGASRRGAHRSSSTTESQRPGSLLVAHYQLFPDVPQARTGPVRAPSARAGSSASASAPAAAWFHHGDACPRVYSSAFLSSLSRGGGGGVPVELYAYRARPSWKDARDESGHFVPKAPAQTILGRASVPLQALQSLPLAQPPASALRGPAAHSPLIAFLQCHTAFSGRVPLLNPCNPLPEPIGSLSVEVGWGSASDLALLGRIERGALAAQKVVRGFLVRRRARRERIARHLAEEEEMEEEAEAVAEEQRRTAQQQQQGALGLGLRSPTFSTPSGSLAASPRAPSLRSPSGGAASKQQQQQHFRDQASSPLAGGGVGSARALPSFHLNLPQALSPSRRGSGASGAGGASRREMGTSPLPSARKAHPAHSAPHHPGLHHHAHVSAPLADSVPAHPFVPAPRAEDKKDFISYSFSRGGVRTAAAAAAQAKEHDRAQSVRSFADSLSLIQQTREALAAAAAGVSVPSTPSTRTQLGRSSSPPRSASRAWEKEKEEQERSRKFAEDSLAQQQQQQRSPQHVQPSPMKAHFRPSAAEFSSSPQRQPQWQQAPSFSAPATSPPRARPAFVGGGAAASRNNVAATPESGRDSEEEEEEEEEVEDYLGEHYSDVDVSEYSDDEDQTGAPSPAASPLRARGPARAAAAPSPLVRPAPSPATVAIPQASLPSPPLDASVARQRLHQQMAELDEMQRRMQWRLSGRRMEEMPPQPQLQPQEEKEPQAPAKPVSPAQYQPQQQAAPGARSPDRDSIASPSFLSPSPPAAGAGAALPSLFAPAPHPSTPARPAPSAASASRAAPVTPTTPAPFLSSFASPSPPPAAAAAVSSERAAFPSSSPMLARSSSESSIPEELSAQPPPPSQELLASPPVLVNNVVVQNMPPSPPQQSFAATAASTTSASAPPPATGSSRAPPVNQWLQRGVVSPSRVVEHPQHGDSAGGDKDHGADAYGSDYGSDVSSGESDSDHDSDGEEDEWDVRVTGGRDVRVRVEYDPSAGSSSAAAAAAAAAAHDPGAAASSAASRMTHAHERARLFPQGLRPDPSEPGASPTAHGSYESSHSAPAPSSSSSSSSGRWDSNFQPSEEDARRMERIARIMQSEQ